MIAGPRRVSTRPGRHPRVSRAVVALTAAIALVAGACGGDDDVLRGDRLAEELTKAQIPEDVAACVADELPDGLSQSAIEQRDEDESAKFLEALGICSEQLGPQVSIPDPSITDDSLPDVTLPTVVVPSTPADG